MSCSYLLRAFRWRYFFTDTQPSLFDSYRVLIIGFLMNNVLPARIGELVRAQVGGKVMRRSRAQVLGTVAGERLFDGLTISAFFGVLYPLTSHAHSSQSSGIYLVAYGFVGAFLLLIVTLVFWRHIFKILTKLQTTFAKGAAAEYALVRLGRFIDGFRSLRSPKRLAMLTFLSLGVWLIELMVYFQVASAFQMQMPIGALSLFLAVVNFSSLIPAAPGGLGVIEAIATMALVEIGFDRELSLAMVATQHLIQILVVGVPGALCFFLYFKHSASEAIDSGDEELGQASS